MPIIKVSVKWGKKKFDDVELNTDEPGVTFKTQLFSLTGVPIERQKIMVKGGTLKDDSNWKDLNVKEGQSFMMMGSADELPQEPVKKTVFMEDLSSEDSQMMLEDFGHPAGLRNLGNTCYMNATLQCLKSVPELETQLKRFRENMKEGDNANNITSTLRDLFIATSNSTQPVGPLIFLQTLRSAFPQFAQRGNSGEYMQQDAEECYTQIMMSLSQKLPKIGSDSNNSKPSLTSSAVTQLFSGELATTLSNSENPEEAKVTKTERFDKLSCHISSSTTFVIEGIKESLEEKISKHSESLGREAVYTKSSKITVLPYYLTVQFVRFFWKTDTKVKAKIVKPVEFPFVLDLYEFCSDELKTKLPKRKLIQEYEDKKLQQARESKDKNNNQQGGKGKEEQENKPVPMEVSMDPSKFVNETGMYELFAVLTHKGRMADGGHYVAWVRAEETGSDKWFKYDDDKVSQCNSEEIKKLSGKGGGDWHMAYLCFYRTITPTL